MKVQNSIKICFFILYSFFLIFVGSFFYKYKTSIAFYVDPPLEAEYLMNDVHSESFVFNVFQYGNVSIPYKYLGANKNNSYLIDKILAYNKISYVVSRDKNDGYNIYLSHSSKDILLNSLFRFIFFETQ